MKRILFTCSYGNPTPHSGGPNKIIFELLNNLVSKDYNLNYFSGHYKYADIKKKDLLDLQVSKLGIQRSIRTLFFNNYKIYRALVSNRFYLNFTFFKSEFNFKRKRNQFSDIEVLHAHDIFSSYFFRSLKSIKILTIHTKGPARLDLQDYVGKKNLFNYQTRKINDTEHAAFQKADYVTFPSHFAKELFLRHNKLDDSSKIKIVYNGINLEEINSANSECAIMDELEISKDYDLLILNIAAHVNAKKIDNVLSIIKYLLSSKKNNPLFLNVGQGTETKYLLGLVDRYHIQNNVVFIPQLNHSQILSLMKKFDILLSLSERVIFDMVILEAMACGMVVIASNEGGNKEVIKNGFNGYLVNSQEECIDRILNYDPFVGLEAKNTVKEFSIDKMVSGYKTLYSI